MSVLPDLLAPGLKLVIVGTAAGRASALKGCYYAGPGNRFWRTLHEVGLTPIELRPDEYARLIDYGIGLTDLAKGAFGADADLKPADFDRIRLRSVIKTTAPYAVAFNGKNATAQFFGVRARRSITADRKKRSGERSSTPAPKLLRSTGTGRVSHGMR